MKIGIPKEIKDSENRVALTPTGARLLVEAGHKVYVQTAAGEGSGLADTDYQQAGVRLASANEVWQADLILKVKEPLTSEYDSFRENQIIFTFLHLAGIPKTLTDALLARKVTAIAYETLEDDQGQLPLLAPMSAVAGNMATLMGAYYLARFNQGKGMQLGSILGQSYGKVVIIGDGVVGQHAARVACAMGASVFIAGLSLDSTTALRAEFPQNCQYFDSNPANIAEHTQDADLVIGAVLCHGAKAPYVVNNTMVRSMLPGSVIVDVSIDQGGCIETSRPTSHTQPVFEKYGVTHYCVTNMPGAYPQTATLALTSATLPYVLLLANEGAKAFIQHPHYRKAINAYQGNITYQPVAEALGLMSRYQALVF